jgi:methylenetetrahydrofolate reductase (NADPH)
MSKQTTSLRERLASGRPVLLAEIAPPRSADPKPLRAAAARLAGAVHALGISDNKDGISMAALAAASVVASEGLEPILHVTTRDRNRIALLSEALGAHALGVRNVLCTSGDHQTLGTCREARNVYDVDAVQLLQLYARLAVDDPFCLGAVASPEAGPSELQFMRTAKKVQAGALFLVTQPVVDLERFRSWWQEVTRRGLHEQVAIVAGIELQLHAVPPAAGTAGRRPPSPSLPEAVAARLAAAADPNARRALAVETIRGLSDCRGLRGFSIAGGDDGAAALDIIAQSGLRSD